ncbi:hypothetical protein [Fontibacillus sp. BL9]|uniref:hypothetical protein n=1 Tax=Fontibacillus sp. BL9 TaxID=3389971 RepID=UPI00397B7FFE
MENSAQVFVNDGYAKEVDPEWVNLLIMAKEAGIPIDVVRGFLRGDYRVCLEQNG